MFATHQNRLVKELALAGIADMAGANRYIRETYPPAFNAEFPRPAREAGSAFVRMSEPGMLDDILCEVHERAVGRDNCVRFDRPTPRIEPGRERPHYARAKVRVRRHMDGHLSVWHGPRLLRRYGADGRPLPGALAEAAWVDSAAAPPRSLRSLRGAAEKGGAGIGEPDSLFVLKPDMSIC